MNPEYKENLKNSNNWMRALTIVILGVIFWISLIILGFVVVLGLICLLITNSKLDNLSNFGKLLGSYMKQIIDYATLNSDQKPFPFGDWPSESPTEQAEQVSQPAEPPSQADTEEPPPAPKKSKKKVTRKKKVSKKTSAKEESS